MLELIKTHILNPIVGVLSGVALVYFIWGVVQFVKSPDNETIRTTGKTHMLYGVIGLTIMVSVYGILNVICRTVTACT